MKKVSTLIKFNLIVITGIIIGAIAGYLYRHWFGFVAGACLIISNSYCSSLYFALLGGLFFSLFKKENSNVRSH